MNRLLSSKSGQLVEKLGFHKRTYRGTTATSYLQAVFAEKVDYVINLDEDAFISDIDEFLALLEYVIDHNYVNVGMPDGGTVEIRQHNPCVTNPFFNIFKVSELRNHLKGARCFSVEERKSMLELFPQERLRTGYDLEPFEPYEDMLLEVLLAGKTLWLDAYEFGDGISTVLLSHRNRPFLIHTWYAREFYGKSSQRRRIAAAFRFASGDTRLISKPNDLFLVFVDVSARIFAKARNQGKRLQRKIAPSS